jgi:glyoxylase-like metal-dependent hydrolase (beta-lactamase superfamily II)
MARKQEQEDARREITEVAPGIARMELPISMPGLGHVNCYALLDREGAAIVDPGLPGTATWRALQDRLKQLDLEPRHVHTVVITHSHPDHFGAASRFQREAGSKIIAHCHFGEDWYGHAHQPEVSSDDMEAQREAIDEQERERVPDFDQKREDAQKKKRLRPSSRWNGPSPWGGSRVRPPFRYRVMRRVGNLLQRDSFVPDITDPVEHGNVLHLADREWFVHHTPGHTLDHFCLHDPDQGIFLSGDHVLPTITPHISGMTSGIDPLQQFFYALDRVGEISGVHEVLPAHGHPFRELAKRTDAIKRHHAERLEKIRQISREIGPATVEAFSQRLFKPRSWGPMADSETYAHLEHLRIAGEAESHRDEDGALRYQTR